jgi:uncharacterized protein
VLYWAKKIAKKEKCNEKILECAVWLHDIGRLFGSKKDHAYVSAVKGKEILLKLGFPTDFIEKVVECVKSHSNGKPKSTEAKILWDADRIDLTGAIGVHRAYLQAFENNKFNIEKFDEFIKRKTKNLLKNMKTKTGKEIAKKRLWLTRTFIKELMKDLKCDDEY